MFEAALVTVKSTGHVAFRREGLQAPRLRICDSTSARASFDSEVKLEMATKLYVGNLSFRTTGDELKELFAQAGTVESVTVIEDRETGRSRGFGFVEMATPEEAATAIEQFNGKDLGGRNLTVNEARPKTDRGGGGGGGYRDRGGYGGGGGDRDYGRNDREPRW